MSGALRFDEGKPDYTHIHPDVWASMLYDYEIEIRVFNDCMDNWYYFEHNINPEELIYQRLITLATPVLEFGSKKYATLNYALGMDFSRVMKSFRRHTMAIVQGEELDPESGLPHLGHMACNILFALTYMCDPAIIEKYDDRPLALRKDETELGQSLIKAGKQAIEYLALRKENSEA